VNEARHARVAVIYFSGGRYHRAIETPPSRLCHLDGLFDERR